MLVGSVVTPNTLGRNEEYPIKGIDTLRFWLIVIAVKYGRNGVYPIKGIDTFLWLSYTQLLLM